MDITRADIQNKIDEVIELNPKIEHNDLKVEISEWLDNIHIEEIADSKLEDAKSDIEIAKDIEHEEFKERILDDLFSYNLGGEK